MSYALVGVRPAATGIGASGASSTPSYGQSPTAGNLLILWCGVSGNTLPATPTGWSLGVQVKDSGSRCSSSIFYKIAAGADAQPTIAGMTNSFISTALAEFSGNSATPLDQTGQASEATAATPLIPTCSLADLALGELVVTCDFASYSTTTTVTNSDTYNNGATANRIDNNGSAKSHYGFSYGITTSNSAADSNTYALTTTNLQSATSVIASFKLASSGTHISLTNEPLAAAADIIVEWSGGGLVQDKLNIGIATTLSI